MHFLEISTFVIYFFAIIAITLLTTHKQRSDTDFVIGNRSLNFYLTALSAHASEMSGWLFLAYPAIIFTTGLFNAWISVGLVIYMFLNWQIVAPKLRKITGEKNNLTLNAFFESRFNDKSGIIRTLSALVTLIFFISYIGAGLIGLGLLVETLFGLHYITGITIGLFIVVFYVFLGGYKTVAWIDLIQGLFLLVVILLVPLILINQFGGIDILINAAKEQNLSYTLFPKITPKSALEILIIASGWGLGYFGQPQIVTKFMGIKKVSDMSKAKYVGISWQALAMIGATLIGLIGIYLFPGGLANSEIVTLEIVKKSLSPFFAGLVLCAILAATTNVMAAQILVLASSLSEDIYKRFINTRASHGRVLKLSRFFVIAVAIVGYFIAFFMDTTIYNLVRYSWSGVGAAFGPLVLSSLHSKKINKYGAIAGIIIGATLSAIWPAVNKIFNADFPPIIPSFILSYISIYLFSYITNNFNKK